MTNRKLPFGYKIENGEIVINQNEQPIVREIFTRYVAGESLKEIANRLNGQPITYDIGVAWNKNNVSRILLDRRYMGEKEYPKIIESSDFAKAEEVRKSKSRPQTTSELQKLLRKLNRDKIPQNEIEELMSELIRNPSVIRIPEIERKAIQLAQTEFDRAIAQQPLDEKSAKELAIQSAAEQYENLGSEEYETERIRREFENSEYSAELLKSCVAEIYRKENSICLRLKNGQIIERSAKNG